MSLSFLCLDFSSGFLAGFTERWKSWLVGVMCYSCCWAFWDKARGAGRGGGEEKQLGNNFIRTEQLTGRTRTWGRIWNTDRLTHRQVQRKTKTETKLKIEQMTGRKQREVFQLESRHNIWICTENNNYIDTTQYKENIDDVTGKAITGGHVYGIQTNTLLNVPLYHSPIFHSRGTMGWL